MRADQLFFFALSALISLVAAGALAVRLVPAERIAPAPGRIGHLDGLRGYLAFSVLLHHAAIYIAASVNGQDWSAPDLALLEQLGSGAVALFFMVSGAVFYPVVLKGVGTDWIGFVVKRVFRVLPLVALSVILVIVVLMAVSGRMPGRDDVPRFLIWLSSWHQPPLLGITGAKYLNAQVLSSLQWEWLLYFLIVPSCAIIRDILRRLQLQTIVIPAALLLLSLAGRVLDSGEQTLTGATWWNTLPLFAAGMLAVECIARPAWRTLLGEGVSGAAGAVCLLVAITYSRDAYGWSMPLFAFFFVTIACGNSLGGLLDKPVALALGELSFAVYLLHGLVLWLGHRALNPIAGDSAGPTLLALPLLAFLAIAVAALANRAVERPAMVAGAWLAARLARRDNGKMVNGLVRLSH